MTAQDVQAVEKELARRATTQDARARRERALGNYQGAEFYIGAASAYRNAVNLLRGEKPTVHEGSP